MDVEITRELLDVAIGFSMFAVLAVFGMLIFED